LLQTPEATQIDGRRCRDRTQEIALSLVGWMITDGVVEGEEVVLDRLDA
jgi:hypothetical protein